MDYSQTVTHLEFAAGYAGIGLGLRRIIPGLRCIAYVEIEAFAVANLVAKMEAGLLPAAPVWPDIKTFPSSEFHGIVDILSAGYPCQPFSTAGNRKGTEDPRHLWPYICAAIEVIQPGICFFENVEGHITLGLSTVLSDLGELGYHVEAGIFSAAEVGAPHQRKRVFILGIREGYQLGDSFLYGHSSPSDSGKVTRGEEEGRVQKSEGAGNELADSLNFGCRGRSFRGSGGDDTSRFPESEQERDRIRGETSGCGGELRNELPNAFQQGLEGQPGHGHGGEESGRERAQAHRPAGPVRTVWPARPNEYQPGWEPPRTVVNPTGARSQDRGGQKSQSPATESERSGGVGQSTSDDQRRVSDGENRQRVSSGRSGQSGAGGAFKSPVGGDADGDSDWMDYAELQQAGDNRADELRMCGNGVVPATVAKAFMSLYNQLAS